MNDNTAGDLSQRIPTLSPAQYAAEEAIHIETMIELLTTIDESRSQAAWVTRLRGLVARFREISAIATSEEFERLELEFLAFLGEHPPLVSVHLAASYCEGARAARGCDSSDIPPDRRGATEPSHDSASSDLRRKVDELESDMRHQLDAFKRAIADGA